MTSDPQHDWRNCPGLAEQRAEISGIKIIVEKRETWADARFADWREDIDRRLVVLNACVEELRHAFAGRIRDVQASAKEDIVRADTRLDRGAKNFDRVFGRLNRIERLMIVHWILIGLLGIVNLGRGGLWLWEALRAVIGK